LRWKVASLQEPTPQSTIEQAYANMLLAGQGLENARKDLQKAEKLWKDKRNLAWHFIPQHAFRLNMLQLEYAVTLSEEKYNNAVEKYAEVQEPADAIDLEQAETGLALAAARLRQAIQDHQVLSGGPDPDRVSLAEARIRAAKAGLLSAQAAYAESRLLAPFSGRIVSIPFKEGEWLLSGQQVMVLASEEEWIVEIDDLAESEVASVQAGQVVAVTIDALPGIELEGKVDSTALIYREKDGDVTYQVIITLAGTNPDLRWGMTARVRFPGR
jgi:multidrug resistance efflux pump